MSTDLAEALEDAGLRGFALDDVQVTVDDQFRTLDPGSAARLPGWRWLRPGHGPDDDLWVDDLARLHVRRRALDVLRSFPLEHCAVELA